MRTEIMEKEFQDTVIKEIIEHCRPVTCNKRNGACSECKIYSKCQNGDKIKKAVSG